MAKNKQTIKMNQLLKNKKILLSIILVVLLVGSATTYILIKQGKHKQEQTQTETSTTKEPEKISEEAPIVEVQPTDSQTAPTTKEPEKKQDTKTPTANTNLPEISQSSPKLTLDKIEKIKLEMTENDVKAIVGSDVYESAKKAGQNLGSVTINLEDNSGGIVFILDQGKLTSLTRTYPLKAKTATSFNKVTKGMAKEEVVAAVGLPTTETGEKGTFVYLYQYSENQEEQTKIVIFDSSDKVSVVQ